MRIKEARQPPLLNPLSRSSDEWMRLSPEDEAIIRSDLERWGRHGVPSVVGELIHYMRGVGLGVEVSEKVKRLLRNDVTRDRRKKSRTITEALFLLDRLVEPTTPTKEDISVMTADLDSCRRIPNGRAMAQTMYHMRHFNMMPPVSDEDLRIIREDVETLRRGHDGWWLTKTLFHLKKIGADVRLTKGDYDIIRESLAEHRNQQSGSFIAGQLYMLHELRENDVGERTLMPPLKRFAR